MHAQVARVHAGDNVARRHRVAWAYETSLEDSVERYRRKTPCFRFDYTFTRDLVRYGNTEQSDCRNASNDAFPESMSVNAAMAYTLQPGEDPGFGLLVKDQGRSNVPTRRVHQLPQLRLMNILRLTKEQPNTNCLLVCLQQATEHGVVVRLLHKLLVYPSRMLIAARKWWADSRRAAVPGFLGRFGQMPNEPPSTAQSRARQPT